MTSVNANRNCCQYRKLLIIWVRYFAWVSTRIKWIQSKRPINLAQDALQYFTSARLSFLTSTNWCTYEVHIFSVDKTTHSHARMFVQFTFHAVHLMGSETPATDVFSHLIWCMIYTRLTSAPKKCIVHDASTGLMVSLIIFFLQIFLQSHYRVGNGATKQTYNPWEG